MKKFHKTLTPTPNGFMKAFFLFFLGGGASRIKDQTVLLECLTVEKGLKMAKCFQSSLSFM